MKKLLKFGIASLSLTVLAGAGLVAETVFANEGEATVSTTSAIAVEETADTNGRLASVAVSDFGTVAATTETPSEKTGPILIKGIDTDGELLSGPGLVMYPESDNYTVVAESIDGYTPISYYILAQSFLWAEKGSGEKASFSHKDAFSRGEQLVDVIFTYSKNETIPPKTLEEDFTAPKDKEIETDTPTPRPQPEPPKEDQTPPTPETPAPTPTPETPEERQARINHNLRVLRSEVERVERALTYPKLTPTEAAALQAFKAKRLETIAHLEQTGELGDNNLTEADVKAFDTVLALELAGVFNDKDAEQPISTPASKDLAADRNKLLLSVDESGLTDQQKGELAIKITFAETEKDLADLKAELVKLVKAAEKPANKSAKEAPKTESKAPAAAAKPAANAPAKSDKAALPATGDVTRVGLIAAGFSLLLLGLGLAKSRKHN